MLLGVKPSVQRMQLAVFQLGTRDDCLKRNVKDNTITFMQCGNALASSRACTAATAPDKRVEGGRDEEERMVARGGVRRRGWGRGEE